MGKLVDTKHQSLVRELTTYLERAGARIEYDEAFGDSYALDFTVTRFKDVHAHVNLGVHVTAQPENLDEIERFSQVTKRGLTHKALYIEIDQETIAAGGLLVAFGACLSFLFDKRNHAARACGLRIAQDCTYTFFDLEDALIKLRHSSAAADLTVGEELLGRIVAYFTDKGFGFIQTDDERKFFFHIANIVDDELRTRLPSYVPGEIIPVDFQYGGNDGKKYPKAVNVVYGYDDDEDDEA